MTAAGGHDTADEHPASYRESAARVVRYEEEHSVIAYDEPWRWTHLVGWSCCLFWNGVTAFFLTLSPWLALFLAGHLYAGVSMAYEMLRWGRSKFTLVVSPSHLECEVRPFSSVWAWRAKREDIADVLVTQRLFKDDSTDWAEWIVSVRLNSQATHVLFRRNSAPDAPLPEGMDQLARHLAYELLRPVTREVRDERKG
ncbi:MAG: hypothetical protein IPG17_26530 [Sandaracinaceae bacterium]|nr:hypothetical protein [Sandaracinaceae bacterium]MBP7683517.1 hypothetical protein [Deltaproteobacteria bacterium]MBK6812309.1 hypothetical protein [Sandaracinaceae bacterium]MBK7156449.1 hypothetical protein [Sandaracinaceae bacterium]MBK7774942.1 hypothetical protein [Sandaracinaceae bacterium]